MWKIFITKFMKYHIHHLHNFKYLTHYFYKSLPPKWWKAFLIFLIRKIFIAYRSSSGTQASYFDAQSLRDSSFVLYAQSLTDSSFASLAFISWSLRRYYLQFRLLKCLSSLGSALSLSSTDCCGGTTYSSDFAKACLHWVVLSRFRLLTVAEELPTVQTSQVLVWTG